MLTGPLQYHLLMKRPRLIDTKRASLFCLVYDNQLLNSFLLLCLQPAEIDTSIHLTDIDAICSGISISAIHFPNQTSTDIVYEYSHIGTVIHGEAYPWKTCRVTGEEQLIDRSCLPELIDTHEYLTIL